MTATKKDTTPKRKFGPTILPDVDLDTEEIYLDDGTRLTNELADEMAERAIEHHYRVRGKPES